MMRLDRKWYGSVEVLLCTPAQFNNDRIPPWATDVVARWFAQMWEQRGDDRLICLNLECEEVFEHGKHPAAVCMIRLGWDDHAIAAGICAGCYGKGHPYLTDVVYAALRAYWPDYDITEGLV